MMDRINLIKYYSLEKFKKKLSIFILLLLVLSFFMNEKYMSSNAYLKNSLNLNQLILQNDEINGRIQENQRVDEDNMKSEEELSVLRDMDEFFQRKKEINNKIYREILSNAPQNISFEEIIFSNGQSTIIGTSINSFLPINFVNNLERCGIFLRPNLDEINRENSVRFKISFAIENLELIKVEIEE